MRRASFVIAIVGMFFLTLMIYDHSGNSDFESKIVNERIVVSGILSSVRSSTYATFFKIGEYDAYCDCDVFAYSGKDITAEGLVSEYSGKKMIKVLSLRG